MTTSDEITDCNRLNTPFPHTPLLRPYRAAKPKKHERPCLEPVIGLSIFGYMTVQHGSLQGRGPAPHIKITKHFFLSRYMPIKTYLGLFLIPTKQSIHSLKIVPNKCSMYMD